MAEKILTPELETKIKELVEKDTNRLGIKKALEDTELKTINYKKLESLIHKKFGKVWVPSDKKWQQTEEKNFNLARIRKPKKEKKVGNKDANSSQNTDKDIMKLNKSLNELSKKLSQEIKTLAQRMESIADDLEKMKVNESNPQHSTQNNGDILNSEVLTLLEYAKITNGKSVKISTSVNSEIFEKVKKYIKGKFKTNDTKSKIIEMAFIDIIYRNHIK